MEITEQNQDINQSNPEIGGSNRMESNPENPAEIHQPRYSRGTSQENWNKLLKLDKTFKVSELASVLKLSSNGASSQVRRWESRGLVKKLESGIYSRMADNLGEQNLAEKPFKCDKCNKSFPTLGGLNIHKYRHSVRGKKHGQKIGELNKLRKGEIRGTYNKTIPAENHVIAPEIQNEQIKKLCFCPHCGNSVKYVEASMNLK